MSVAEGPVAATGVTAPPYEAALAISGLQWQSRLAHNGRVSLSQPEVHIGILSNNDVVLSDRKASRLHAAIRWTPVGYVIQDLQSQHGTFVDGHQITQPTLLVPGQRIRIGDTELTFEQAVGPPPTGAPSRMQQWLMLQRGKKYWLIFVVGVVSFLISAAVINIKPLEYSNLIPMLLFLGASVVPVAFVAFCYEEGAFVDMPPTTVALAFLSGGILAAVLIIPLEVLLLNGNPPAIITALVAGVVEETLKAGAVVWLLRDPRLRSELDGLVLGAAAGMGYAAIETAGYGFGLLGFINGIGQALQTSNCVADPTPCFTAGVAQMEQVLMLRGLLAMFGHGVWTAILCAAIWRERGTATFRLTGGVVLAWTISVCLHWMWDFIGFSSTSNAIYFVMVIVIGIPGLLVLRFFIKEAVARAKLGPLAPPPPPLGRALGDYLLHLLPSVGIPAQTHPAVAAALSAATPVPVPVANAPGRFCPQCGAPTTAGSRFCATCGSSLQSS